MTNSRSHPAEGSTSRFDDLADAIALYALLRSGRSEVAGLSRRIPECAPGALAWACEVADESSFRALGPVVCDALGRPARPGIAGGDIAVDPGAAALVQRAVRFIRGALGPQPERPPLSGGLRDPWLIRAAAVLSPGGFEVRLGFSLASTGVRPASLEDTAEDLARTGLDARFLVDGGRAEWVLGVSCAELIASAVRTGGDSTGVFVACGGSELPGLAGRVGPPIARLSRVLIGDGARGRPGALRFEPPWPGAGEFVTDFRGRVRIAG